MWGSVQEDKTALRANHSPSQPAARQMGPGTPPEAISAGWHHAPHPHPSLLCQANPRPRLLTTHCCQVPHPFWERTEGVSAEHLQTHWAFLPPVISQQLGLGLFLRTTMQSCQEPARDSKVLQHRKPWLQQISNKSTSKTHSQPRTTHLLIIAKNPNGYCFIEVW